MTESIECGVYSPLENVYQKGCKRKKPWIYFGKNIQ